jgi:hypothetical protein
VHHHSAPAQQNKDFKPLVTIQLLLAEFYSQTLKLDLYLYQPLQSEQRSYLQRDSSPAPWQRVTPEISNEFRFSGKFDSSYRINDTKLKSIKAIEKKD